MTAKIKLNAASGGGSLSIQAPSSSSNNRVLAYLTLDANTTGEENTAVLTSILQVMQLLQIIKGRSVLVH